jgi:hypothetical protein
MRKLTEEHKLKLCKPKLNGEYRGEKHHNWKGEKAGYRAVHKWIQKRLGKPEKCEGCGKDRLKGKKIQWASISGKNLRLLFDWARLCASCHKKFDLLGKKYNKKLN